MGLYFFAPKFISENPRGVNYTMEKAQQIVQVVQEYMSGDRTLDRLCIAAFDCILVGRDLPKCSIDIIQPPNQDSEEFISAVEKVFNCILNAVSPGGRIDNVAVVAINMAVRMVLQDMVLYSCLDLTMPSGLGAAKEQDRQTPEPASDWEYCHPTKEQDRQTPEPASDWEYCHPTKEPGNYYQDIRNVGWRPSLRRWARVIRDYDGMQKEIKQYRLGPRNTTSLCDTVVTLADMWYMPGFQAYRPVIQQNISGNPSGLIDSIEDKLRQIEVALSEEGLQLNAEPIIADILVEMDKSPLGIVFPEDMPVSIGQADTPSNVQPTAQQNQDMLEVIHDYYRGSRSFDQLCDTYFKLVEIHLIADYRILVGRDILSQITGQAVSPIRRDIESGFDGILALLGGGPVLSSDIYRVLYEVFCAIRDSPVAVTIPDYLPVESFARQRFAEANSHCNLEEVARLDINQQPEECVVEVPVKIEPVSPRATGGTPTMLPECSTAPASISAERRRVARILLEAYLEVCCPLEG